MSNTLPKTCPACGSKVETAEPWYYEDPEYTHYACGAVIQGFADGVEVEEKCGPNVPEDTPDEEYNTEWDCLFEEVDDKFRKWERDESARRAKQYEGKKARVA